MKAIFNKSDWQCARKEIIEQHAPQIIRANCPDWLVVNKACIELIVDGALALIVDPRVKNFNLLDKDKISEQFKEFTILYAKTILKEQYKLSDLEISFILCGNAQEDLEYTWKETYAAKDKAQAFKKEIEKCITSPAEMAKMQQRTEKFVIAAGQAGYLEKSTAESVNKALHAIHIIFCQNIKAAMHKKWF